MMRLHDGAGLPPAQDTPQPAVAEHPEQTATAGRRHLVVVTTRALDPGDVGSPGTRVRTRYWHPRLQHWSENDFESLEHARRLFIDEQGWVLRQEQSLDARLATELIFEARRIDFTRPSREQILRDIGMTPETVTELLDQVDREKE